VRSAAVDNVHRLVEPRQSQWRVATNQKHGLYSAAILYVVRATMPSEASSC
jgi:hypothetical protein